MKDGIKEDSESERREHWRGWILTVITRNCINFKKENSVMLLKPILRRGFDLGLI